MSRQSIAVTARYYVLIADSHTWKVYAHGKLISLLMSTPGLRSVFCRQNAHGTTTAAEATGPASKSEVVFRHNRCCVLYCKSPFTTTLLIWADFGRLLLQARHKKTICAVGKRLSLLQLGLPGFPGWFVFPNMPSVLAGMNHLYREAAVDTVCSGVPVHSSTQHAVNVVLVIGQLAAGGCSGCWLLACAAAAVTNHSWLHNAATVLHV